MLPMFKTHGPCLYPVFLHQSPSQQEKKNIQKKVVYWCRPFLKPPHPKPKKTEKNQRTILLVGGFSPTHLKNMQPSNWIISPNIRGENSKIFELATWGPCPSFWGDLALTICPPKKISGNLRELSRKIGEA